MPKNSKKKLFEEFPPIPTIKWEEKIKTDLKGIDYRETLIWKTIEGIDIKPFYRKNDLDELDYLSGEPGLFPFSRGNKINLNDWEICQLIPVQHIDTANKDALKALEWGATSIEFKIDKGVIRDSSDITSLLMGIPIETTRISFYTVSDHSNLPALLHSEIKSRGSQSEDIKGLIGFDPIGEFVLTGRVGEVEQEIIEPAKKIFPYIKQNLPGFKFLVLNGKNFKDAGSTIVQELGYTLSVGAEYLSLFSDAGWSIDDIAPGIQFNFAVGSNYFMEIAKIRAARLLWADIVKAYKPASTETSKAYIHTITSDWNKTAYDPYVNLLRTTTEAMSSSLGGTDSLTVLPFDSVYKKSSAFSKRLARNIQIILKEEAYFNKVIDPAAGSYYVEYLTDAIAGEAWKLFLSIEDNGGFINAFRKEIIQTEIEKNARQRESNIAFRRKNFLGTNQYPNLDEEILKNIDPSIHQHENDVDLKQDAKPLKLYRATEPFEKLRLRTEQFKGKKPTVFLFKVGNLAMRIARATFSSNFFGCAGFRVIEGSGYSSVDEGIVDVLDHKPDVVVICSSDEEYEEFVPELFRKVNGQALFVVAGYPEKLVDHFEKMGIHYFIHTNSNLLETLQQFQHELGIE